MSKEITKKAVDMLLNGATLLVEPCPCVAPATGRLDLALLPADRARS